LVYGMLSQRTVTNHASCCSKLPMPGRTPSVSELEGTR
jgi:hypothetical protein